MLKIEPEAGDIIEVESTPLAGGADPLTATAMVAVPAGFSRFLLRATFAP